MKTIFSYFQLLYFILLSTTINAQTSTGHYSINKWKIDGDGGWDLLAVDENAQTLYISHGNIVQAINIKTSQVRGAIPDTKGVHAIALAPDLGKGFISDGRDTAVTIFKLSDLSVIDKIRVTGTNPDAILYDPFSHKVFAFNGKSNNATVIEATSGKILATIPLDGKPELAVSDGAGKVYVNIEDKSNISVINPVTMEVEKSWPIAPGEEPSGLALDNKNHRLFTVCDNKLMIVMDATDGKVVAKLPIGEGVDGAAFDPGLKRVYSSNGEGTLTIVQEDDANHFHVLDNLKTQKGARTIAVNTTTHHLYLPTADFGVKPEPTTENPHPRAPVAPGSFVILDVQPGSKF